MTNQHPDDNSPTTEPMTQNELSAVTVSGIVVQAGHIDSVHYYMEPPRIPVPRQLPAAPRYFVGREDDLAGLTADVAADTPGTVLISALAGSGGIGKTALALHWSYQNLARFPDGQLFIDLQGFSPNNAPVEPAVAVRAFLDAFEIDPGRIPVDLQAQAALYRSLVAGRRMLILLDNARHTDQVIPLLPGSQSCTVIVTSRRYLAGLVTRHGARHRRLGVLTEADADRLIRLRLGADRVAAEPAATAELLACCGGFALALDIVAARAHLSPDTPLNELAAELRDNTKRLAALDIEDDPSASLPAALLWSRRALTDEQALVFELVASAPGPDIGLDAAASLVGLPPTRVENLLRSLEQASLLDRDRRSRYSMHDLIRAYATTSGSRHLPPATQQAALRRVVDHYLHTASAAVEQLAPDRWRLTLDPPAAGCQPQLLPDRSSALAWFDTEHQCLLATQQTAITRQWHQAVTDLAWAVDTFHVRRGHRYDRLAMWRAAVTASDRLTDATTRAMARRVLGVAYSALGRHDTATDHLYDALALAEHDITEQANTHFALAWVSTRQRDRHRARHHAAEALRRYRTLGHPVWEARAHNAVGWTAAQLGDHDTARHHCLAALGLHQQGKDLSGRAETLDSLGYIEHHTGNHRDAVQHYQAAVELWRAMGDSYQVANALDGLGHPYVALGDYEQAGAVWREAWERYRHQGYDKDADRIRGQLDDLDRRTAGS